MTADAPGGAWSVSIAGADGMTVQAAVATTGRPQVQAGANREGTGDSA